MSRISYSFCPMCGKELVGETIRECRSCKWTHYDNPIPVVCNLASRLGDNKRSIILVRRGIPPFKGEWCLPCGYINRHENPKDAAVREMIEETGLSIRLEGILCICNPMPGELNQIIISYLSRITGGELRAGDDAMEARFFTGENCPMPCFRSHRMLVSKWWEGRFRELNGKDLD